MNDKTSSESLRPELKTNLHVNLLPTKSPDANDSAVPLCICFYKSPSPLFWQCVQRFLSDLPRLWNKTLYHMRRPRIAESLPNSLAQHCPFTVLKCVLCWETALLWLTLHCEGKSGPREDLMDRENENKRRTSPWHSSGCLWHGARSIKLHLVHSAFLQQPVLYHRVSAGTDPHTATCLVPKYTVCANASVQCLRALRWIVWILDHKPIEKISGPKKKQSF